MVEEMTGKMTKQAHNHDPGDPKSNQGRNKKVKRNCITHEIGVDNTETSDQADLREFTAGPRVYQAAVSVSPWSTEKGGCQSNSCLIFDELTCNEPSSRSMTACFPRIFPMKRKRNTGNGHRRTDTPSALPSRRINSAVERSSPSLAR